jgi:serine/threonine-protein kinase SIK3
MQNTMHSNSATSFNNTIVNNNIKKQIKIGNYALGMTIGKGNSAVVKLATHLITKQKVAIKMFDKSGLDSEKQLRLRREIDSMKRLKHKNIIRLYEVSYFLISSLKTYFN